MRTTGIVTDSHSSISQSEAEKLGIFVLPMPFYMNETCYYEGINITREEFLERLGRLEDISTSQPSPEAVMELWDKALSQYEDILYIPISSGLSGSCQTAMMLAQEEKYEGKVYVVDNGSVSTPLHRSILDALELLEAGCSAAEVKERMEKVKTKAGIYIAVDDLKYLKHGGRISAGVALVGGLLNVKPVLHFDIGREKGDCRILSAGIRCGKYAHCGSFQCRKRGDGCLGQRNRSGVSGPDHSLRRPVLWCDLPHRTRRTGNRVHLQTVISSTSQ